MTKHGGLAITHAYGVTQFPNGGVLDTETSPRLGNAYALIVADEALTLYHFEQSLAFLAIGKLGGKARRKVGQFLPIIISS